MSRLREIIKVFSKEYRLLCLWSLLLPISLPVGTVFAAVPASSRYQVQRLHLEEELDQLKHKYFKAVLRQEKGVDQITRKMKLVLRNKAKLQWSQYRMRKNRNQLFEVIAVVPTDFDMIADAQDLTKQEQEKMISLFKDYVQQENLFNKRINNVLHEKSEGENTPDDLENTKQHLLKLYLERSEVMRSTLAAISNVARKGELDADYTYRAFLRIQRRN